MAGCTAVWGAALWIGPLYAYWAVKWYNGQKQVKAIKRGRLIGIELYFVQNDTEFVLNA